MEENNVEMQISGGNNSASSRWNPTKEQISMLEGLYRQGIRTPSAEQIQQITSRLKAYGHIEGKNVFYWFQNHKARQRQKQKQENMAYFNRFLHKSSSPCTNVICSPFYTPHRGVGYYPQYPKVLLPSGTTKRPMEKIMKVNVSGGAGAGYKPVQVMHRGDANEENISHETLALFPLHPTGILEGNSVNSSTSNSAGSSISSGNQNFFDFFAENGSCESD